MWRITEIRRRRDGARLVTVGVEEPEYHGQHQILVLPDDDVESKLQEEMKAFYDSFSVQEWEASPIKVGDTFEIDERGNIKKRRPPSDAEIKDKAWMEVARDERQPLPPPPTVHTYEIYNEEILHPKSRVPIVLGRELINFTEELTPSEIRDLETKTGKKVRKVA